MIDVHQESWLTWRIYLKESAVLADQQNCGCSQDQPQLVSLYGWSTSKISWSAVIPLHGWGTQRKRADNLLNGRTQRKKPAFRVHQPHRQNSSGSAITGSGVICSIFKSFMMLFPMPWCTVKLLIEKKVMWLVLTNHSPISSAQPITPTLREPSVLQ